MPHQYERKLVRIGESSLGVIIPKAWTKYYDLTDNDRIDLISDDKIIIRRKEDDEK